MFRRSVLVVAFASTTSNAPCSAQALSAEDAGQLKASLLGDLETMRGKFVGLADAFPQDKYN